MDETGARALLLMLPLWGAIHQGHAAEIAALSDRVLERWPDGDEPARPEATAVAVNAYLFDGQVRRAADLARAVLARPSATNLARMIALRTLGLVAHHAGDHGAAGDHFGAAQAAAAATRMAAFERELAISRASVLGDTGHPEEALTMLEQVATLARREGDPLNEAWARLVAAQHLLLAGRRADARAALDAAEAVRLRYGYPSYEYPFGLKASDRLRAVLATLDEGWHATRPTWQGVIDRIASSGDVGQLAITLRTAAALAIRDGEVDVAGALLAAAPGRTHVTVLAPLFQGELPPSLRDGAPARAGDGEAGGAALRRVRELLVTPATAAAVQPLESAASPATSAAIPAGGTPSDAMLASTGGGWSVSFAGRAVQVRPMKGLEDLAVLFSRPHQEVHCLELIGGSDLGNDAMSGLDERARREYRTRVRDLQEAIDEAHSAHDPLRAERAEAELDALVQQLSASFGLAGRPRPSGSAVERARSAVTWRIRAAVKKIAEVHPELGRHLRNAVRTGTWCAYRPETEITWRIESPERT
jgi:tetratricopeptide (TPR) repeat protein